MKKTKEIYLAGGCFWGTEHYFKLIEGVVNTQEPHRLLPPAAVAVRVCKEGKVWSWRVP